MSSIYTNTQYTNVPKNPSYPYGYPHLSASLPQTHYPYDSVYDVTYQKHVKHPKYRWYGNMQYPYHVQRHRMPKVFTEPKPTFAVHNGYYYSTNSYPPYVYWYPNPTKCRDMCGEKTCQEYYYKLNNYLNCKRCQNRRGSKGQPLCFDPNKQKCVECAPELALIPCEDRFGCANPQGLPHRRGPPIDPRKTGCQMCK